MSDSSTGALSDRIYTGSQNKVWNAVFTDKDNDDVSVNDFLNLMVTQLKNQDFMNPVDDTQFVTQLAQFATMKAMDQMAAYSETTYATSLAGKNVTAAKFTVSGDLDKVTGPVEKVTLTNDGEFEVYVKGKAFTLDQIMEVNGSTSADKDQVQADVSELHVKAEYDSGKVHVQWPRATSDTTVLEDLKYYIYYSKEETIDTVAEAEKYGSYVYAGKGDITEETLSGLADGKYYFTVVVEDKNENRAIYKKDGPVTVGTGEAEA